MDRNAQAEFTTSHIPSARFFDIDAIAAPDGDLPHMLPTAEIFAHHMNALGISSDKKIITYDRSVFLSSARAWWMLRMFGHSDVAVLDGGWCAWLDAGGPVASGDNEIPLSETIFTPSAATQAQVILMDQLRGLVETGTAPQILDARASARFEGKAPEPRPGLRSGHIPGALNLPINDILDANTGLLKSKEELRALFDEAGIDWHKPVITSCGSGVTAAGLTLAFALLGKTDVHLFDGSWTQWGSSDAPIETGPVGKG
jgi:thiosulfate/3-mercaptopyruvate sulfurtransferase